MKAYKIFVLKKSVRNTIIIFYILARLNNITQYTDLSSQINIISKPNYEFFGELDNQGQKEGFGILKWKNNNILKGIFSKNIIKDWGILNYYQGDVYKGQFLNEKANGYGEYYHQNGGLYIGYWEQNLQEDIGIEIWNDNSKYLGPYVNYFSVKCNHWF